MCLLLELLHGLDILPDDNQPETRTRDEFKASNEIDELIYQMFFNKDKHEFLGYLSARCLYYVRHLAEEEGRKLDEFPEIADQKKFVLCVFVSYVEDLLCEKYATMKNVTPHDMRRAIIESPYRYARPTNVHWEKIRDILSDIHPENAEKYARFCETISEHFVQYMWSPSDNAGWLVLRPTAVINE